MEVDMFRPAPLQEIDYVFRYSGCDYQHESFGVELLKISAGRAAAPEKDLMIPHDLDD